MIIFELSIKIVQIIFVSFKSSVQSELFLFPVISFYFSHIKTQQNRGFQKIIT